MKWAKMIGAEKEDAPFCNESSMGKEATQIIDRLHTALLCWGTGKAETKLLNDYD